MIRLQELKSIYGPAFTFAVEQGAGLSTTIVVATPIESRLEFDERWSDAEQFKQLDGLVQLHFDRLLGETVLGQRIIADKRAIHDTWAREFETIMIATGLQKPAIDELVKRIKERNSR